MVPSPSAITAGYPGFVCILPCIDKISDTKSTSEPHRSVMISSTDRWRLWHRFSTWSGTNFVLRSIWHRVLNQFWHFGYFVHPAARTHCPVSNVETLRSVIKSRYLDNPDGTICLGRYNTGPHVHAGFRRLSLTQKPHRFKYWNGNPG